MRNILETTVKRSIDLSILNKLESHIVNQIWNKFSVLVIDIIPLSQEAIRMCSLMRNEENKKLQI